MKSTRSRVEQLEWIAGEANSRRDVITVRVIVDGDGPDRVIDVREYLTKQAPPVGGGEVAHDDGNGNTATAQEL